MGWHRESSEGDLHHLFAYKFAGPCDITSTVPIQMRILSHLMLDGLPDEAFPEVLELLANAWSFNVPSSQKIELPQRRVLKGKVTKRYERLAYSLGEQE
jgi:hypothetical protein